MTAVAPGQAITFRSACPTCGEAAEWEHRRGPLLYDERGQPMGGSDSYRIWCGGCG